MKEEAKEYPATQNEEQYEITKEEQNGWSILNLGNKLSHIRLDREWPALEFRKSFTSSTKWISEIGELKVRTEQANPLDKESKVCIRIHGDKTPEEIKKYHAFAVELRRELVFDTKADSNVLHTFESQKSHSLDTSRSGPSIAKIELSRPRSEPEECATAQGNSKGAALEASPQSRRGTPSGAGAFDAAKNAEGPTEEVEPPKDGHRKHLEGLCEIRRNNFQKEGSKPRDRSNNRRPHVETSNEMRRGSKAKEIDKDNNVTDVDMDKENIQEYDKEPRRCFECGKNVTNPVWTKLIVPETKMTNRPCCSIECLQSYCLHKAGTTELLKPETEITRDYERCYQCSTAINVESIRCAECNKNELQEPQRFIVCKNCIHIFVCPLCGCKPGKEVSKQRCGICDNETSDLEPHNGAPLTCAKVCGDCRNNHVIQETAETIMLYSIDT